LLFWRVLPLFFAKTIINIDDLASFAWIASQARNDGGTIPAKTMKNIADLAS